MLSGLPWGLALISGFNTYLPLFVLAILVRFGHVVPVSPRFEWLVSTPAIIILGLLTILEIAAQKFPVLDNIWDFPHTFIRPIAGALAAGATLNVHDPFEVVLAMIGGGALAGVAHSAKSSLRLVSTTKSFGTTNFILSVGEDAGVLIGTLLSVYAPWVMLVLVLLFLALGAWLGPRVIRALRFDVAVVTALGAWLWHKLWGAQPPGEMRESLWNFTPGALRAFREPLPQGEELLGALKVWNRSVKGLRRVSLLLTSSRLILVEKAFLRRPRFTFIPCRDIALFRRKSVIVYERLDILTQRSESFALCIPKTQTPFSRMLAAKVEELRNTPGHAESQAPPERPVTIELT
jgi:Domain of unknown function (DUF4126)